MTVPGVVRDLCAQTALDVAIDSLVAILWASFLSIDKGSRGLRQQSFLAKTGRSAVQAWVSRFPECATFFDSAVVLSRRSFLA